MDPLTITQSSFSLWDAKGNQVSVTPGYDSATNTAVLQPPIPLNYGATYTVRVDSTIAAVDGTPLQAPVTWQFTTTLVGAPIGVDSGAGKYSYYTSSTGSLFLPDQFVTGGTVRTVTDPIAGTTDPAIYQSERTGTFTYKLPVPDGQYDLKLHFAETKYTAANQRVFDIDVAETTAAPDLHLDIYAQAGADKALVKTIPGVWASGPGNGAWGTITITSTAIVGEPVIAAIEVVPLQPKVASTLPAAGATGVGLRNTAVSATFAQTMDPVTMTSATFTLTAADGTVVPATVSYSSVKKMVTLTASQSLAPNKTYTARLDDSIKSLPGMKLAAPVIWSFTTGTK
jgi:hypothetical protein